MEKIGLIGTGMLGNAVGTHLIESGFNLTVYNRTKEKTKNLENLGANVVDSPMEVAKNSNLLFTIVKDANAVKQVSFEKSGIVYGKHENLVVCDMSTINPLESKWISKKFSENSIKMLDTPVMGGPNVAITGNLVLMAGGPKEIFENCKEIFDVIANHVFYLGESGTAHAVKLAMNLQITMLALALSEGITFARGAKIDPKIFLEILNSTYFKTGMSENKAYKMIQNNFEPTFTLENLRKDISTIAETSKSYGLKLPMAEMAKETYEKAVKEGFGDLDYTGILAFIKKLNGQN